MGNIVGTAEYFSCASIKVWILRQSLRGRTDMIFDLFTLSVDAEPAVSRVDGATFHGI